MGPIRHCLLTDKGLMQTLIEAFKSGKYLTDRRLPIELTSVNNTVNSLNLFKPALTKLTLNCMLKM